MVCIVNKKVDIMEDHVKFMKTALALAERAARGEDVPVGAVIVKDGTVIASAFNEREKGNDATAHAEILAIREACKIVGSWRLSECDLYVTLEPCPMCAGAIINSRIRHVYYGAKDARGGALGSVMDLRSYPLFSKPLVTGGICEAESRAVLQTFFKTKREK